MQWKKIGVLVAAGALAAAAACGAPPSERGSDGGTRAEPRDTSAIGDATDPNAKAPAPEVPGAQKGGTLTIYTSSSPHTLDPTRAYYTDSTAILRLVTRALTQYQYRDGKMVLVPDMATDLGQHNEDFTEWTFTLRDGLKYEDGSPVTSEDVAYAIKRQLAIEELPDGPLYGLDYYLDGDKYQGPYKDGDNFRAVETPDDKTIVIKLRRPFPDMPFFASFPDFTGIPKDKDTREEYGNHPLATGPYKFERYVPGKELILVRNDQWDPATDTSRHQYVDRYHFQFAQDPVRFYTQLIEDQGEDQTAMTYTDVLSEKLPDIEGTPVEERLVKGRNSCTYYVYMNTREIPLEVRKALAVAYPIESLHKVAGDIRDLTWYPATSILNPTTPGWLEYDVLGTGGEGDGDPVKAKKMLEKAGKLGFELSWYVRENDPIDPQVSQLRKEKLEAAGFKAKPIPTTKEKLREQLSDPDAPVNLRVHSGWCNDWPSGSSVFPAQWDPRKNDEPGVPNPAFLDAPEIADRIDEILQMPVEKGLAEWGKLDKYIMEKYVPVIPYGADGDAVLRGSKVQNVHWDEVLGMPDFPQIYISQ
ncbi:MAG TPA: ABC transporter substrate-binding protein [Actinopolymorphaceae bacterium]|jgi:peptide/nickel transport system substrate-binding protein